MIPFGLSVVLSSSCLCVRVFGKFRHLDVQRIMEFICHAPRTNRGKRATICDDAGTVF